MEIINLPDDLKLQGLSSFKVFDYQASKACLKQMVSLHQNTFSFLIEGSKEVVSDKTSISIEKSNFLLMKTNLKEGHGLHQYIITVYTLKTDKLGLNKDMTPAVVGYYLWNNTLAKASIIIYYQRSK